MEVPKSNVRTRKMMNYAATSGDGSSDNSDDDFAINTKISKLSSITPKPPKLSKLKLGSRKETKLPRCDNTHFTELKPISDKITLPKVIQPPMTADPKIVEDMDFSMAEPDLITHSIFSQETVITSSCGCLSSHELTDSSDSETFGTTFELSTTGKKIKSKKNIVTDDVDFKHWKKNKYKMSKRRVISGIDLNKNKKIKVESKEREKLDTLMSEESISKLGLHDSDDTSLPPVSRLSPCLKMVDRLSTEQLFPHCQNLDVIASLDDGNVIPIFAQDNNTYSSVKQKIKMPKNNNHFDEAEEDPSIPSTTQHILVASNEFRPVIEPPVEAVSTAKTAKRATRNELKRNLLLKGKPENLKGNANLTPRIDKSKDALKLTTSIHSTIVDDYGALNNDNLNGFEMLPSKNIPTTQNLVHIFKPPSPPSKKFAVKWKPPGKADGGGRNTFPSGDSPATGIRLGLSRNRRASKPLHPDVKVKI